MSLRIRRLRTSLIAVSLATSGLALPFADVAHAAQARVVVAGSTPLPPGATVVAATLIAHFDVALTLKDPAGLRSYLSDLTNSSSLLYRRFLTPAQFAQRFGASSATIHAVRSYLAQYHLRVRLMNAGATLLEMQGSTRDVARAFTTPVETVRSADGSLHAEFSAPATLPVRIAHDVTAVAGLSSVVTPSAHLASSRTTTGHTTGAVASTCSRAQGSGTNAPNSYGGYTVQQQAQLYGLAGAWAAGKTGVGQTIALYELGQYDAIDAANFFSCYSLNPSLHAINVDGGATGGFSDEATMDVEAAGALAPGAALEVYQAPNGTTSVVDLYARIASDDTATIVSTSWGDCEIDPTGTVAAEQVIFEQMAAQGQTVVAASGDNGSSDCTGVVSNAPAVDDPASQPFVTGVGGLTVSSIANPLSQTVWNANGGAGGGGTSQIWSRPAWQSAPSITAAQTMRMVPDLSVMADPSTGFMQNFTGHKNPQAQNWNSIGGTSIGAPLVSALVAVAAQVCGTARLGFLNPTFYRLARASQGFVDVTTGKNDLRGTGVYSAGPGYDMASGLGSPSNTLVDELCPTPVNTSHSTLVNFTSNSIAGNASHLTVALRDATGNPVVDSQVTLIAHGPGGQVLFDADPSSVKAHGSALYSVASDTHGYAAFTLTSSRTGPVVLTVKLNGALLYHTTVIFHPLPLARQKPLAPTITHVVARAQGAVISVAAHRAMTPFVEALQVTFDGGRTWHSYPGRSTRIVVAHLKGRTIYVIRLRARNANGYSPVSHAIRITTLL